MTNYTQLSRGNNVADKALKKAMSQLGRMWGAKGGKRSLETMTPEQRMARARKAGQASATARKARKDSAV